MCCLCFWFRSITRRFHFFVFFCYSILVAIFHFNMKHIHTTHDKCLDNSYAATKLPSAVFHRTACIYNGHILWAAVIQIDIIFFPSTQASIMFCSFRFLLLSAHFESSFGGRFFAFFSRARWPWMTHHLIRCRADGFYLWKNLSVRWIDRFAEFFFLLLLLLPLLLWMNPSISRQRAYTFSTTIWTQGQWWMPINISF